MRACAFCNRERPVSRLSSAKLIVGDEPVVIWFCKSKCECWTGRTTGKPTELPVGW